MAGKSFTQLAGEHYFCFRAAMKDLHVALTRGNAPNVDVLISSKDGSRLLAVQVKAMCNAWKPQKKHAENSRWEWPVTTIRSVEACSFLFAFVHLEPGDEKVFIVPAAVVAKWIGEPSKSDPYPFFYIFDSEPETRPEGHYCTDCTRKAFLENWEKIDELLAPK